MKSIFISSTFKDMQAERDLLHERIFPRLRKVIAEYGEDVQELDLRWGVDTANMTEEESGRLVLKVCIDAIDRCLPFIIVLLGERYGWIPREDIVVSAQDTRVDEHYIPGMSVTNLEVQYGALREEEVLERCVFCMRCPEVIDEIEPEYRGIYEGESAEHKQKLSDLKQKIREKDRAVILDYDAKWDADKHKISGLEAFGEELYAILEKMIREEYKDYKEKDWQEKILLETKRTKELYLSSYVERPIEEAQVYNSIYGAILSGRFSEDQRITPVIGVAGTGKSALMAASAEKLEKLGYPVILYFSGNPGCQDPKVLKQMMIYELENILHMEHEESGMSLDDRLNMLDEKVQDINVVCVIDALDQLYEKESDPRLDFLSLCPHIAFLVSSLDDFEYVGADGRHFSKWTMYRQTYVRDITKENTEQMIAYTAGKRGKKLDDVVTADVMEKENSGNPLYLSNMLQRFFMMDGKEFEEAENLAAGMEGIHLYMEQLLNEMPEKQEEMVLYLLNETMHHFEAEYLYEVMCLIALSKYGLKESELSGILQMESKTFAQIEFQQLVSYLYEAFVQKEDGKWTFKHRLFTEAMKNHMSEEEKTYYMNLLVQYAKEDKSFRKQEGYYYVFEQKADFGAELIEEWESCDVALLGEYIAKLVKQDNSYKQYFLDMAEKQRTDQFAFFWETKFHEYAYNKEVREFHILMLRALIEKASLSPKRLCECMNKVMSWGTKEDRCELLENYIEKVEMMLLWIEEAEKEYQSSAVYIWKSFVAGALDHLEQALECTQKALEHIERAEKLRPEDEDIQYRKICLKSDLFWYYVQVKGEVRPELLKSALEDITRNHKELDNSKFTRERFSILGDLMRCHCSTDAGCFNMELANEYGDQALLSGREWIQKYPTVDNRSAFIRILYQMADISQRRYQYVFYKEAYEHAKSMYEICRTERAKETYAGACYNRGRTAVYAREEYYKGNAYKDGYKIEEKAGELEQEIPKYLEEAAGLYQELLNDHKDNQKYFRYLQDCRLEKARFEFSIMTSFEYDPELEFLKTHYNHIIEEMKPAAEEILENGSNYYIYDVCEVLADTERYVENYSELAQYAAIMEQTAMKLLEKKDSLWNRRRMLKSWIYQALILYKSGEDAEVYLKKAYELYQKMNAEAREGQEKLADRLYDMYIQTMVEKKNPEYAKHLEEEAKQMGCSISYNYYDKAIRLEENEYTSAYVLGNTLEIWDKIEEVEKPDARQAEHMVRKLSTILIAEDFQREKSRWEEFGEILTRIAEYKEIAGWPELCEEEILLFQKYIADSYCEDAKVSYWKYVVRYAKDVDVKLWRPILLYVIQYCCAAEAYKDALLYLKQIEEEKFADEMTEELQFIKIVCQGVIAEKHQELEKAKELIKPLRQMSYFQKLCKKELRSLEKYEEYLCYAAWGLLAYLAEGEEKSWYFKKLLAAGAIHRKDAVRWKGDIISRMHLFEREDTEELIACMSAADLLEISWALKEIIADLRNVKVEMKVKLQIADKLAQMNQKEYQEEAWFYYRWAFNTGWFEPEESPELNLEEVEKMDLEAVELYVRAHDGMMNTTEKYTRKLLKKYLPLMMNYYDRTKDDRLLWKVMEDKKKIDQMKATDDSESMKLAEREMMKFFRELILMGEVQWMQEFLIYLKEWYGHLRRMRLTALVEFREAVRGWVSLEEIEQFNQMLEIKAKYDMEVSEIQLKDTLKRNEEMRILKSKRPKKKD